MLTAYLYTWGSPLEKKIKQAMIGGVITLGLLAPMTGAQAAPMVQNHWSHSHYHDSQQAKPQVENYTIKHTKRGAIIEGKLSNVKSYQRVTLRVAGKELKGQTGRFEWEYTDKQGNFRINVHDFNDYKDRYWQLEFGGGWSAYSTYGDILAKGKISAGKTDSKNPSIPAPKPEEPSVPPTPKPTPTDPPVIENPTPTPEGDFTKGSGGAYTDRQFVSYSAAGKTGQYHIYADGINTSKPVGVVFQFHGDGGYEFKNPSYKLPSLNKVVKDQNMIFVSMKAPNSQNVWWDNVDANGDYARSLIENEIYKKYNLDKSKAWMVGYSGGAEFIAYEMMEEQSDLFAGGGALMFGGGGAPRGFTNTPSDNLKKNFNMIWHVGLDDGMGNSDPGWSALDDAKKGYEFYKSQGFEKANLETPVGIDHFEYNEPKVFSERLSAFSQKS